MRRDLLLSLIKYACWKIVKESICSVMIRVLFSCITRWFCNTASMFRARVCLLLSERDLLLLLVLCVSVHVWRCVPSKTLVVVYFIEVCVFV